MFEKQKAVFEERYRGLLEDAVRDAIYFSSRNSELMRENKEQAQGKRDIKFITQKYPYLSLRSYMGQMWNSYSVKQDVQDSPVLKILGKALLS